ncbi:unnamed protein product [Closterium sp. Yama58-4]|nr:unnamed protein product [Closterium sp. Yama58-4]
MPITTITPLVFVIGLAMLKELWEDIKRGASDYETNKRKIRVILPDGSEAMREWRELRVGDIVQVEGDTYFPADLICLASSSDDGSCYVETMNLDGETNLKLRQALHETYSLDGSQLARLRGTVECEHPNVSIYTFTGKMRLEGLQETPIFLSPTNILLRGSKLRNTRFAVGLVVYSGRETKIMMNATDPPSKRSFVERRLDYVIIFELVLMLSLAIFPAAVFAARLPYQEQYMWYLELDQNAQLTGLNKAQYNADNPALAGVLQFFTCLVLYGELFDTPSHPLPSHPLSSHPLPRDPFPTHPPLSSPPLSSPPLSSPPLSSPPLSSPPLSSPPLSSPPLSSPPLSSPSLSSPPLSSPPLSSPSLSSPPLSSPPLSPPSLSSPPLSSPYLSSPPRSSLEVMHLLQSANAALSLLVSSISSLLLLQAVTISFDLHMYYEDKDIPALARTSNINEELGMVRTVLSDKTGTLTRNQMEFFKCSIAGTPYGMGVTEVEKAAAQRAGRPPPEEDEDDEQVYVPERPLEKGFNMRDPRLDGMKWVEQPCADEIRRGCGGGGGMGNGAGGVGVGASPGMKSSSSSVSVASGGSSVRGGGAVSAGTGVMGVGGTPLLPGEGESGGETPSPLLPGGEEAVDGEAVRFLAESPDEAAFVVAAKRLGFLFLGRQGNQLKVREYGAQWSVVQDRSYELLNTLEFTSHRKRMSVVVRTPEGRLLLLCKGADSVIMDRLGTSEQAQKYRPITERHMTMYAEAGLRTLAIAWREVGEEEYAAWQQRWVDAKGYVADAGVQAERLEALADELESGLALVGATAIEDKLQVGVPQAIEALAQAGIKLWVLTGDKLETAINIGFACSLLRHHMQQHLVFLEDNDAAAKEAARRGVPLKDFAAELVRSQILAASESVHAAQWARAQHARSTQASSNGADNRAEEHSGDGGRSEGESGSGSESGSEGGAAQEHAVVIDGKALALVLADDALRAAFLELALQCASVICCRVSPKQKAQVTAMVRREGQQICLAIGDGANDVGMIQKANIGVGIRGEEGQQAVMASDFAIGQFRFLERLLLVHGGWCYKRICILITYFFYKCFVFAFTILFYNCLAYFSGTSVYYDWYLTLFMVFFTSLPIGVVGIMDQDVKAVYRLRYPQLYKQGQRNEYFSVLNVASWMVNGLVQAGIIFALTLLPFALVPDRSSGLILDLTAIGTIMYAAVVTTVNLELGSNVQYWNVLHFLTIFGSILFFFILMTVGSYLPAKWVGNLVGVAAQLLPAASFWLNLVLAVVGAMLPSYAIRGIWRLLLAVVTAMTLFGGFGGEGVGSLGWDWEGRTGKEQMEGTGTLVPHIICSHSHCIPPAARRQLLAQPASGSGGRNAAVLRCPRDLEVLGGIGKGEKGKRVCEQLVQKNCVNKVVGIAGVNTVAPQAFNHSSLMLTVSPPLPLLSTCCVSSHGRHVCPGDHEVVQEIERRERRRRLMRLSTMARHMCAGAPLVTNHSASGAADVERSAHGSAGSDDRGEGKGKKKGVGGVGNGVVGEYHVAAEKGPSVAEELRHRHSSSRDTQQ